MYNCIYSALSTNSTYLAKQSYSKYLILYVHMCTYAVHMCICFNICHRCIERAMMNSTYFLVFVQAEFTEVTDAIYFWRYAMATYGWPLYVFGNPLTGCCRLCCKSP